MALSSGRWWTRCPMKLVPDIPQHLVRFHTVCILFIAVSGPRFYWHSTYHVSGRAHGLLVCLGGSLDCRDGGLLLTLRWSRDHLTNKRDALLGRRLKPV